MTTGTGALLGFGAVIFVGAMIFVVAVIFEGATIFLCFFGEGIIFLTSTGYAYWRLDTGLSRPERLEGLC